MGAAIALNASLRRHWRICSVVAIGGESKMIVNDAILEGLQTPLKQLSTVSLDIHGIKKLVLLQTASKWQHILGK